MSDIYTPPFPTIRSDNGSEFTAKTVREWLPRVNVQTLYIEPGSPWMSAVRTHHRPPFSLRQGSGREKGQTAMLSSP
ncbi:MAG: hypothetical protein ACKVK8_08850 [Rhodospirillales bacterium]